MCLPLIPGVLHYVREASKKKKEKKTTRWCVHSPDRACSERFLTFPHLMYTLWKVADHEYHTSDQSYPAHGHTRPETHKSDQLKLLRHAYGYGAKPLGMCCEQLPSAAASGGVREARGGSLHASARAPAS